MKRKGFTLIEMMMVLSVVALVVMIGFPTFIKKMRASPLDQAVQDFQGVCRNARAQAVVSGWPVEVAVFLLNEVSIESSRLEPPSAPDALMGETVSRVVIDRLELPDTIKVKLANDEWEPDEEGAVRFRFHPNGTCDYMSLLFSGGQTYEYYVEMVEPAGRVRVGQLE